MTNPEIISSINKWNSLVLSNDPKAADAMVSAFQQGGNCFSYTLDEYSQKCELLHLYPGIYKNELYFFVIPADYDKEEYKDVLYKYTTPCKVYFNLGSNQIPDTVAKARIDRWKENYKSWIPTQAKSPVGMFQAFVLEVGDFELKETLVTMGLLSDKTYNLDRADLIVTNQDDDLVLYDDAASVVPPYGPSALTTDFYLLSL